MDQKTVSLYELPPTPPVEFRFPSAFRGLPLALNKLRYAFQQMLEVFVYQIQTWGKRTPPVHRHASQGHIYSIQLPEDLTNSLIQRARKEGMTLNSVLNTADVVGCQSASLRRSRFRCRRFRLQVCVRMSNHHWAMKIWLVIFPYCVTRFSSVEALTSGHWRVVCTRRFIHH